MPTSTNNRDDFSPSVPPKLARRAGYICSNPDCRLSTSVAAVSDDGSEYFGEASHIAAASPGGSRYDADMTHEQRADISNGIHLCKVCARRVDVNNGVDYPATLLHKWKKEHEEWVRKGGHKSQISPKQLSSDFASVVQDLLRSNAAENRSIEGTLSPFLDNIRAAIDANRPKDALRRLNELRGQYWDALSRTVRARIAHYQGNSHYALGKLDEAAFCYMEAYGEAPDEEHTMSHAALAYLISKDNSRAAQISRETLQRFPASTLSASVLLHATNPEDIEAFLQEEIPAPIHKSFEVLMNCANIAQLHGDLVSSERWAREIIQRNPSYASPCALLGEVLFTRALEVLQVKIATVRHVQHSEEAKRLLTESEAAYTTAWDKIADSEVCENHVNWLVNRASVRKLLEKDEEAKEDFNESLRLSPDMPEVRQAQALIAIEEDDVDRGLALLRQLTHPTVVEQTKNVLTLSEILIQRGNSGDLAEARDLLKGVEEPTQASMFRESAAALLIILEAQADNHDEARALATKHLLAYHASIKMLIAAAYAMAEDSQSADRKGLHDLLNRAVAQINHLTSPIQRLELGRLLFRMERYHETATVLEPVCLLGENDFATFATVYSFYRVKSWNQARIMAQAIVEKQGPCPRYSEILAAILDGIGDLTAAIIVTAEYVNKFSNDLGMRLRLAVLYARSGDNESLSQLFEKPLSIASSQPDDAVRLVAILDRLDKREEALRMAYEARQRFPWEAVVHSCYVKFFLFAGRREIPNFVNAPNEVTTNTYVTTVDDNNTERGYWIEEEPFCKGTEFLGSSHPLAKQLMGKRVGDTLVRSGAASAPAAYRPKLTVKSVESVYVHAFLESRDHYEEWFPDDANGFFTVNLAKPGEVASDTGEPNLDFTPLFQMIDAHDQRRQKVESFYNDHLLPLATVAQIAGRDIWITWRAYAGDTSRRIRCNRGDRDTFDKAVALAASEKRFAADPTALLTLYHLPYRERLIAKTGALLVTQSVIDEFRQAAESHRAEGKNDSMTVNREGEDAYLYHESTHADRIVDQEETDRILRWVLDNTEVRPLNLLLGEDASTFDQFREVLGLGYSDPILLARELRVPLYTDDLALAEFGRVEHKIDSISTPALLLSMHQTKELEEVEYEESQIRLLSWNYEFVPVDSSTIVRAAEMSNWLPQGSFQSVIRTLYGDRSDNASVTIAAEAMRLLIYKVDNSTRRESLITALIYAVTQKRSTYRTIQAIKQYIVKQHMVNDIPIWNPRYEELLKIINSWQSVRIM